MDIAIKSLHTAAQEELKYQIDIKTGKIIPSNSGYRFMNETLLHGFNTSDIITIAGLSSAGKSTLTNELGYNIATLNKNCRVLFMSFEVLGRKLAGKLISKNINVSLRDMYNKDILIDKTEYDVFKGVPFDIVEVPINIDSIYRVISKYSETYPDDRIHVIFDHTLLVTNAKGDSDMETLVLLANFANQYKKAFNIVFILISQMNDAMLSSDRLRNKASHYPKQNDIFGSRAIWHVSDAVYALVAPNRINLPVDRRGIAKYGVHDLPLKGTKSEFVYVHSLKTRDGEPRIDPLINNLKYSNLQEFPLDQRKIFKTKHNI